MVNGMRGVGLKPRWYMLLVAGILTLTLTIGLQAVSAQRGGGAPPPPAELDYLCVNGHSGFMRAVASPSCQPHETLLTLPDDYPFLACANKYSGLMRYAGDDTACRGHETAVPMPPEENQTLICVMPSTGILRHISSPLHCPPAGTIAGVVPPPETVDDSYTTLGHLPIEVPPASGLLANDTVNNGALTGVDATSANGGEIAVNSDGSFSYTPPPAFTGADSFIYTITNSSGSATGTVTLEVSGPIIWIVDSSQAVDGNGTQATPFNTFASLNNDGLDLDAPGDIIYLFSSGTAYSGGIVLEEGQALISQLIDPAALPFITIGVRPAVTNAAGDGITLAGGTFIAGLTVNNTSGAGLSGSGFTGDVTLDQVIVSSPGGGFSALALNAIDGSVTVTSSQVNGRSSTSVGTAITATNVTHISLAEGTVVTGGAGASGLSGSSGSNSIESVGTDITIDAATVRGGAGGSDLFDENLRGGNAIVFTGADLSILNGSTITGGAGGPGLLNAPGPGGHGVLVADSSLNATGSTIRGGNGGGDGSLNGGGAGGSGVQAQNSVVSIEDNSTVTGGNAGNSLFGSLGVGGRGIVESGGALLVNSSTVSGGNGDNRASSPGRPGSSITVDDADLTVTGSTLGMGTGSTSNVRLVTITNDGGAEAIAATLTNNTLQTPAEVPSLLVQTNATTSSICLNASGNSDGASSAPAGPFVLNHVAGSLGITQTTELALSEDNFDVLVEIPGGAISFSCSQ